MKDKYQLTVGQKGEKQLDGLDKIYGANSRTFLKDIGLQKGWIVADVGCGAGQLTCWIAEMVGESGHVFAIDSSPEQLELAKKRAKEKGLNNITYVEKSAYALEPIEKHFDLVYCRFLLHHLVDAKKALESMNRLVKSDGILAYEEQIAGNTGSCYPKNDTHSKIFKIAEKLLLKKGCDEHIGLTAYRYLVETKKYNCHLRLAEPVYADNDFLEWYPKIQLVLLKSISDALLSYKVATQDEISTLEKEIQALKYEKNSIILCGRLAQFWGVKQNS